jgi:hypothetical protein
MAIAVPPRIGASIEAARLVLKEPDLWIPRGPQAGRAPNGTGAEDEAEVAEAALMSPPLCTFGEQMLSLIAWLNSWSGISTRSWSALCR